MLIFLRLHVLGYIGIRIKFLEPVFCFFFLTLNSFHYPVKIKGRGGGGECGQGRSKKMDFLPNKLLKDP